MQNISRAGMRRLGLAGLGMLVPAVARTQVTTTTGARAGGRVEVVQTEAGRIRADSVERLRMTQIASVMRQIDSLSELQAGFPIGSERFQRIERELVAVQRTLPQPSIVRAAATPSSGMTIARDILIAIRTGESEAAYRMITNAMPKGWLGFGAYGRVTQNFTPDALLMQYFEYPQVVTIEPNSPAGRAGIRLGDSLIAYNGRDVRGNIFNFTQLLEPGKTVSVTIRHEGDTKDYTLVVDRVPADEAARRVSNILIAERTASARPAVVASTEPGGFRIYRSPDGATAATRVATERAAVLATETPRAVMMMPSTYGLLGASMQPVDPDLAKSINGMKGTTGIFVTRVGTGSPAARMGLKTGDVILRVESQEVGSMIQLQRLLHDRGPDQKTRFVVLRGGKTEQLTLDGSH